MVWSEDVRWMVIWRRVVRGQSWGRIRKQGAERRAAPQGSEQTDAEEDRGALQTDRRRRDMAGPPRCTAGQHEDRLP